MTARGDIIDYGGTVTDVVPALGIKTLLIKTPVGFVGGTDSFTIDLGDYGCANVYAIVGSSATTTGQVLAVATFTVTGVSAGVATIESSAAGTNVYNIVLFAY